MKRNHKIIAAICLLMIIPCFIVPVSANSRAQEWFGSDGNGVIVMGDSVPLEVTSELLTFDIPTLPYATYRDQETFLAYDSKVTAEYTFYNPTDMTITATLVFPFGKRPEYGSIVTDKYGVMVNGEKINTNLRHTAYSSNFNAEGDAAKLLDEYLEDDFYSPDLTVTKYTYEIGGSEALSESFHIRLSGLKENQAPFTYQGNLGSYRDTKTGDFVFSHNATKLGETQTVSFYVLGESLSELPEAYWSKANGTNPDTIVERQITYLGQEETTFMEFLNQYRANEQVSEVDWYNACVVRFKERENWYNGQRAIRHLSLVGLLQWFEYEITLAPGESITNTVTAPLYPEIEAWNRPIKYNYTYYLSPASCWADFGELEIVINSPYEMLDSNLQGFEKTESGYRLVREGLPTDENGTIDLTFTLEGDDTPLHQPAGDAFTAFSEEMWELGQFIMIIVLELLYALSDWVSNLFS